MENNDINQQVKTMLESANTPLDPELQEYFSEETALGMPCLKHPLVFSVPYVPIMNKQLNDALAYKRSALDKARNHKNWHTFVFLHERPYRCDALVEIAEAVSDEDFWPLVRDVWIDSENVYQLYDEWVNLWESERPHRESVMSPEEQQVFNNFPSVVTIYRGFTVEGGEDGLSWTVDKSRAEWFARRFSNGKGWVAQASVAKEQVLAYFDSRSEKEIVVHPGNIEIESITTVRSNKKAKG